MIGLKEVCGMNIFLYGPPGSGKSTVGRILARRLNRTFVDLDSLIERMAHATIPVIFDKYGEKGFRKRERNALLVVLSEQKKAVVALGGGALLNERNRMDAIHTGQILFIDANLKILETRIKRTPGKRPLVHPEENQQKNKIIDLLTKRKAHYDSFPLRIQSRTGSVEETVDAAQAALGLYYIHGMGNPYDLHVKSGILDQVGTYFQKVNGGRHTVIVGDSHTIPLFGERVAASLREKGIQVSLFEIPAGEDQKHIGTVGKIWAAFLRAGIERKDTVIALGGGVVGDLTGFAAATWLRGVRWVCIPTTLLAMVDSSLGGKTGADLPEGKNLIGAFHPPVTVLTDPSALATLPVAELRCGLAETIKHAVLSRNTDELLKGVSHFSLLEKMAENQTVPSLKDADWLSQFVAMSLSVKVRVITQDPYEKGIRATLNLGHTIGHGLEKASNFSIRHGEGVAIGTVEAAKFARTFETKETKQNPLFFDKLTQVFSSVGLPTTIPAHLDRSQILNAIQLDKKRENGMIRFVLPWNWGNVSLQPVSTEQLRNFLNEM